MLQTCRRWVFLLLLLPALAVLADVHPATAPAVQVLRIRAVIGPAIADYVRKGLEQAAGEAALVVIEIDTPGGLDSAMRDIVQAILASPVPVAGFVSPGGARAASAGTFILYASHVAAMTPASNLGAASPVALGAAGARDPDDDGAKPAKNKAAGGADIMAGKVRNDAAAYLRSLAQLRGRDVAFAEAAVRQADSLSAQEALARGVIDYVADDVPDLLRQLDGVRIEMGNGEARRLRTQHARLDIVEPGWRTQLLSVLTNPQIAVVLMMIGVYGLFFELTSPGFGLPGAAGLICLLMGMVAFQLLPVNWGGVALLFAGTAMMVAEVFIPSFGALGLGGIIAFVLGGLMLTDTDIPGFDLSLPFLVGLALASGLFIIAGGGMAARAHRHRIVTGTAAMQGLTGSVTQQEQGTAYALIRGEQWRVRSKDTLAVGDTVRVIAIDGLTLDVVRQPSPVPRAKENES